MQVTLEVVDGPGLGRKCTVVPARPLLIGRSPRCDFSVGPDAYCARVHVMVQLSDEGCQVRDLGSRNGTRVNGLRLLQGQLQDGDRIQVGGTQIVVHIEPKAITAPTEAPVSVSGAVSDGPRAESSPPVAEPLAASTVIPEPDSVSDEPAAASAEAPEAVLDETPDEPPAAPADEASQGAPSAEIQIIISPEE